VVRSEEKKPLESKHGKTPRGFFIASVFLSFFLEIGACDSGKHPYI
jgi:hypothetical protein